METCCGYGYGPARDLHHLPRIFKGQRELTGRRRNRDAFQGSGPSLGANPFQGALPFTKKRELSPGLPPASPGSVALPHWTLPPPTPPAPTPRVGGETRRRRRGRGRPSPPLRVRGSEPDSLSIGRGRRRPSPVPSERRSPISQDRLTHVQLLFTWNPSPLRPSKFSFEYLLLPPRSAPAAAPPGPSPWASALTAAALLLVAA